MRILLAEDDARQEHRPLADLQILDLAALVQQQLDLQAAAIALRGQSLSQELEAGLLVRGQADLLGQLLRNLLDNAHRYSPQGAAIAVRLWGQGRSACLEVRDEGAGIAPEHLERVFERFWRASPDRHDGGSGLGLAIVSRICRLHGGTIRLSSAPGLGSRFLVELPRAEPARVTRIWPGSALQRRPPWRQRGPTSR